MTDYIPQPYINQAIFFAFFIVFCVGVVAIIKIAVCRVRRMWK